MKLLALLSLCSASFDVAVNAVPTAALDTDGRRGKCSLVQCLVTTHCAFRLTQLLTQVDPTHCAGKGKSTALAIKDFMLSRSKWSCQNRNSCCRRLHETSPLLCCCFGCDKSLVGYSFVQVRVGKLAPLLLLLASVDELCSI